MSAFYIPTRTKVGWRCVHVINWDVWKCLFYSSFMNGLSASIHYLIPDQIEQCSLFLRLRVPCVINFRRYMCSIFLRLRVPCIINFRRYMCSIFLSLRFLL